MKINEKNNKASNNSNIDDKQISKDFSEIFDISENNEDLSTLFIDARVKQGLTQEDVGILMRYELKPKAFLSSMPPCHPGRKLKYIMY